MSQVHPPAKAAGPWDPLSPWPGARPWIWAVLFVLVCYAQGPRFIATLRPERTVGVDFFQDWASAKNFLEGLPIYEKHSVTVERYLGLSSAKNDASTRIDYEFNAHPPPSVFLALPFAWLDYPDATLVWNLVSLGAFGLSIYLLARNVPVDVGYKAIIPLITLALICSPFRQQCVQGQLDFVLLLLIVGAWAAGKAKHSYLAGVLLGVAAAIKLFPAFLLLYFCLTRRWKEVGAACLTFFGITALSIAILGRETYGTYFNEVMPSVEALRSNWINASLPGLWSKLFNPAASQHVEAILPSPVFALALTVLSCLAVLVGLAWITLRARTPSEHDRCFGLAITAMLLVSPITWDHYLVLATLPVVLIWCRLPRSFVWRASFLAVLIALAIEPTLLYSRIPGGYDAGMATPWQTITLLSVQCYGLVGLYVIGVVHARYSAKELLTGEAASPVIA